MTSFGVDAAGSTGSSRGGDGLGVFGDRLGWASDLSGGAGGPALAVVLGGEREGPSTSEGAGLPSLLPPHDPRSGSSIGSSSAVLLSLSSSASSGSLVVSLSSSSPSSSNSSSSSLMD